VSKELIHILFLAAGSDGEVQKEEFDLIRHYRKYYPSLQSITQEEFDLEVAKLSNQVSSGIENQYILAQLGRNLSQQQKSSGYALAVEVCASNFAIVPPETDLLAEIRDIWKIEDKVRDAVDLSVKLRYSV
jgi:hypothetical protein